MTEQELLEIIGDALMRRDRLTEALDQIQAAFHCRQAVLTHTDHLPLFAEA